MMIDNAFVEQANRTNVTGFGGGPSCVRSEKLHLELTHELFTEGQKAYFNCGGERRVAWTINGDGTVTSETDRLMWIQAPWGTRWEGGSTFVGEPCQLTWVDAARLFGHGLLVGLSESDTIALSASQIGSTSASAGYSRGSCRIQFSGNEDWRLPTVAEWHTVIGLEWDKSQEIFPRWRSGERYWIATGRKEPGLERYPDFLLHLFGKERHPNAWLGETSRILDQNITAQNPVMFVRTV